MTDVEVEFKGLKHSRITLSCNGVSLRIAPGEKKYLRRMQDLVLYSRELLHGKPYFYSLTGRVRHFKEKSVVALSMGKKYVATVDSDGRMRVK